LAGDKVLIFAPTKAQGLSIGAGFRPCFLNSDTPEVDEKAEVYIATKVADAGLTIPDVSRVYTSDVDFSIESTLTFDQEAISAGHRTLDDTDNRHYYRISEATIRQRRGRTGRTNDGAFFLYKLSHQQVSDVVYSPIDYLRSMAPSVSRSVRYFPSDVWTVDEPTLMEWARAWDYRPSMSYTQFMLMRGAFQRRRAVNPGLTPAAFIVAMAGTLIGGDISFGMDTNRNPPEVEAAVDEQTGTYLPDNFGLGVQD
jgi:hypothetical protein